MRLLRGVEAVLSSNFNIKRRYDSVKTILSCPLWLQTYVSIVNRCIEHIYHCNNCNHITYDVLLIFPRLFDKCKYEILDELCMKGALHDLIKIHDQFEWSQDDIQGINLAFIVACSNGYLDIAKWLSTVFHLTVADTDRTYLLANFKHHQDVREWLVNTFVTG